MQNKGKKACFLLAFAAVASASVFAVMPENASASEQKKPVDLKKVILLEEDYDYLCDYDFNNDEQVDVFDLMRCQKEYLDILAPPVTTVTTVSETLPQETTTSSAQPSSSGEPPVTTQGSSLSETVPVTEPSVTSAPQTTPVTVPSETSALVTEPTVIVTELPVTTEQTTVTTVTTTTTSVTTTTTMIPVTAPVTTITTVTQPPATTVTTPQTTPVTTMPSRKMISGIRNYPQTGLPTGCEASGLTTAINWYGYRVDCRQIATKYMPQMDFYRDSSGRLIGADFIYTFAGDPTREDMSYGCYIPCMISTVNNYFEAVGSPYRGKNISGLSLRELFKYVANDIPVILISTPDLMNPRQGDSWYTPDGRYVTWQRGHHCNVLVGYDLSANKVYTCDPMYTSVGIVQWDIDDYEAIYNAKGKNAMIIETGSSKPRKAIMGVGETVRYFGYIHSSSTGGSEYYIDSGVYTVSEILSSSVPYPVHLSGLGWVSYDALYENIPAYGSADSGVKDDGTVGTGIYNLKNKGGGRYLNVDYGIDANGTNIYQWSFDGSTEQKFKISNEGSYYRLFAMSSSSGNDKVVTASEVSAGSNVYLYGQHDASKFEWVFRQVSGNSFVIALRSDPSLVLTVSGNGNGTAGGTSYNSDGNVYISKYSEGNSSQIWYVE